MKNLLKRSSAIMLVACVLLSLQAFAAEPNNVSIPEQPKIKMVINEFDAFEDMKNQPNEELKEQGLSDAEISELKETSFEDALYERAQLPVETLRSYGYSDEDISILKDYQGESITKDSEIYARALADCTSELYCTSATTRSMVLHYNWSWDKAPIWMGTDAVALRWQAYARDGDTIDVTQQNTYTIVDYYNQNVTDTKYTTRTFYSPGSSYDNYSNFNAINSKFSMQYNYAYAKKGALWTTLSLDQGITRDIYYVKAAGLYGHTTTKITPSLSFSGDLGLCFTGATQDLAPINYKISNTGLKTPF